VIPLPERYLSPTVLDSEPIEPVDCDTQAVEDFLEATDMLVHMIGKRKLQQLLNQCLDALR
jgi:hypothetical protein